MRLPAALIAVATSISITACSTSSNPTATPANSLSATTARSTPSSSATPTATPASTHATRPPTLEPAPDSPALAKFSRAQVVAALNIASRVGTDSVGDPDLLGHAGLHDNIADFARITQYLTPAATAYLTLYCHDAFRDPANRARVAGLVLVAYQSGKAAADATKGAFLRPPPFDEPFTVQRTTVTVDPKVGVSSNGRMVVTGTASAQIPATKNRVHFVDTSTEKFTYYIAATASQAASVGIDGWYGYPNVTWTRR